MFTQIENDVRQAGRQAGRAFALAPPKFMHRQKKRSKSRLFVNVEPTVYREIKQFPKK